MSARFREETARESERTGSWGGVANGQTRGDCEERCEGFSGEVAGRGEKVGQPAENEGRTHEAFAELTTNSPWTVWLYPGRDPRLSDTTAERSSGTWIETVTGTRMSDPSQRHLQRSASDLLHPGREVQ